MISLNKIVYGRKKSSYCWNLNYELTLDGFCFLFYSYFLCLIFFYQSIIRKKFKRRKFVPLLVCVCMCVNESVWFIYVFLVAFTSMTCWDWMKQALKFNSNDLTKFTARGHLNTATQKKIVLRFTTKLKINKHQNLSIFLFLS